MNAFQVNSRQRNDAKRAIIIVVAVIYAGAVAYGDIMFIQIMRDAFPSGLLGALAIFGAITTAASAITLPIALHKWFSPGLQFWWGIIFWFIDVAALGLNAILAYQKAMGAVDPSMMYWQEISPATPILAIIGWGLAFLFDNSQAVAHAYASTELDVIEEFKTQMLSAVRSDEVYTIIVDGAKQAATNYASQLTGQRHNGTSPQQIHVYQRPVERKSLLSGLAVLFTRKKRTASTTASN